MKRLPLITTPALSIGTKVRPWGKISAIALLSGERYYFLLDRYEGVSMMDAATVEAMAKGEK